MNPTNSPETEEQIRKVYAKDLKAGETIHTVFKADKKEIHTSRQGKPWLAVALHDKTGAVDARVFENVEAADKAFAPGDYLLVKGRVGTFHGKMQIVIDALERIDAGPIDAAEFQWVPPPAPSAPPPPVKEKKAREDEEPKGESASLSHKATRQRLLRLLDNPQLTQAVDVLLRHMERYIDERIAEKLAQGAGAPVRPERSEKKLRPPKVEHRPHGEAKSEGKPEPKRDPSLPEGLSFKPLTELLPKTDAEKAATEPPQG
jgi:RecG-like helicase